MYVKKDGAHGVNYVCYDEEGWTPVTGKRWKRFKVPKCLLRLKAPPQVRATLPSTDSSDSDTSGSDCSLHIPADPNVQYSLHCGKPEL